MQPLFYEDDMTWEASKMAQYVVMPLFIFVFSYLLFRIAGKKAVAEMNSFDLLFVVVVSTIVSQPISSFRIWETILYAGVFFLVYLLFSFLSLDNRLRHYLVEKPTVLIKNGDIQEKGLRKEQMTTASLLGKIRQKGYANAQDVELAVMEDTGKISVIPKAKARALQPQDIQLEPTPTFIPIPLIMNGEVLQKNLKYLNKDFSWLQEKLQAHNVSFNDISDVTLATYNQDGTVHVDTDKGEE